MIEKNRRFPISGTTLAVLLAVCFGLMRLYALPLMPIDETRYVSVAWEMWQSQDWLTPTLNGTPYPHKPPLLFWLINLSWGLFGTSEWVARLTIPAIGLLAFKIVANIVRHVSPTATAEAYWSPLVLFGLSLWFVFLPLTMFDILLSLCLLIAIDGLLRYLRTGRMAMVLISGAGMGFGLLTKGPVILLYWLPLVLSLRLWRPTGTVNTNHYYRAVGIATLLGIFIVLAWAIPAAIHGGPDFARAIFWGQSTGRITNAFDHARPWYWYLLGILGLALPWTTVNLWKAPFLSTPLQRFACGGVVPPFLLLSLISGKQAHYLMPIFPFLAIWISTKLSDVGQERQWGYALLLLIIAGLFLFLPELSLRYFPLMPLSPYSRLAAIFPICFAVIMVLFPRTEWLVFAWPSTLLALLLLLSPPLQRYYNLTPISRTIATLKTEKTSIAYIGEYANQFRFLGRLKTPMKELESSESLQRWISKHPDGLLIDVVKHPTQNQLSIATFSQPFRGSYYLIVPAKQFQAFDEDSN